MVQLTYEIQARQQTTLTPRLQQSVRLLQMSTLEFSREVAEAIATNPFLEEQENPVSPADPEITAEASTAALARDTSAIPADATATDPAAHLNGDAERFTTAAEYTENSTAPNEPNVEYCAPDETPVEPAYSGDYPSAYNADHSDNDVGQWARSHSSLSDVLHEAMCSLKLSDRERLLVEFIIDALDDDGYFRTPFDELALDGSITPAPRKTEWEVALRHVQQLVRPGLAARDLSECLRLQLEAMDEGVAHRDLAIRIVGEALDRLAKNDLAGIARSLGRSESAVKHACALIRTLEPRPASRYSTVDPSCYVVPDVIVRKIGKKWVATSNHGSVPRAQLHTVYAQLFRESRYSERPLMAKALQEARWLIRSLDQRSDTILRVAQAIVERQQTFFDYGDIALRPLMLSEIADELNMHESTVSRATSHKYLASPIGIFEFKHFFSRELATRSGGTCSAGSVRALIQEMIDNEDPRNPLSDVMLAEMLKKQGIIVARRTVSKYRAQIKYPTAELRRVQ